MDPLDLTGTIVPLVTPFTPDEDFDPQAMARLFDFVLQEGADALMATALTGEGPLLTLEETLGVWDFIFTKAGSRIPIVPGIISTTTQKAVKLARYAQERGAAAVMAVPILPELYAGRSHDDVYAFYADIASSTSLPIILFNYPSLTGIDFVPPLIERLASIGNIRYIKESTGDSRRVHAIHRLMGDRISVICGSPNVALESLALGCRAWITGTMNIAPRSARQLMRAVVKAGDLDLARRIYYRQILPFVDVMSRNFNPTGTIKAGLCARGVNVGAPRRPGSPVRMEDQRLIERLVKEVDALEEEAERELQ
jgi:4-hydroxy-tetrahydrodipicolinate synthase